MPITTYGSGIMCEGVIEEKWYQEITTFIKQLGFNTVFYTGKYGIYFNEEYEDHLEIKGLESKEHLLEAFALKIIIDKYLELNPKLIFNGEIRLEYTETNYSLDYITVKNNKVFTSYTQKISNGIVKIPKSFKLILNEEK